MLDNLAQHTIQNLIISHFNFLFFSLNKDKVGEYNYHLKLESEKFKTHEEDQVELEP